MCSSKRPALPFKIDHYDIRLDQLLTSADDQSPMLNFLDCYLKSHRGNEADSGSAKLCIPYWQRDYDWGSDLINHFHDCLIQASERADAENPADHRPFRLGTLVLGRLIQKSEDPQYAPNEFLVLDGQQRLRTICTLFSIAKSKYQLFTDEQLKLPLYYGAGEKLCDLNIIVDEEKNQKESKEKGQAESQTDDTKESREESRIDGKEESKKSVNTLTEDQKSAFAEERIRALHRKNPSMRYWLHLIEVHVIITTFKLDGRTTNVGLFDQVMSRLFTRINLQGRPLSDIDAVKAQLVFRLRTLGRLTEAHALSEEWEKARALVMSSNNAAKENIENLLSRATIWSADPKSDDFRKTFGKLPAMSPDDVRVSLSRYLLLVLAFAKGEAELAHNDAKDLLERQGPLWKKFEQLCTTAGIQALVEFVKALKTINSIFLQWRPYLLLSRSRLTQDFQPDDNDDQADDDDERSENIKWKFLRFQCFLDSSSSADRVWLENPVLLHLLRSIASRKAFGEAAVLTDELFGDVLREAESKVFKKIGETSDERRRQHDILASRDWFLWQAFVAKESSNKPISTKKLSYKAAAIQGLEALLHGDGKSYTHFKPKTADALFRAVSSHFAASLKMPTSTGAEEIEHWVSIERGRTLKGKVQARCDTLENMAHIANGTNQSLRDLSIRAKAKQLDSSWWPTLQFIAAITLEHRGSQIIRDQQDPDYVDDFLDALARFWETVAEAIAQSSSTPVKSALSDDDAKR